MKNACKSEFICIQRSRSERVGGGVGDPTASVVGVAVLVGDMWNVEEKPGTQGNFFW